MSKFYGTLTSDKGQSTRAGHHFIRATAQSFDNSIAVELIGEGEGQMVSITAAKGSTETPSEVLFRGSVNALRLQLGKM
jgi:hypothetical protein